MFAQTPSALKQWDELEQQRYRLENQGEDFSDVVYKMAQVACLDLDKYRKSIILNGIPEQWIKRLTVSTAFPYTISDKEIAEDPTILDFCAALSGFNLEGDKPGCAEYYFYRTSISQLLAVHYYLKTDDLEMAQKHLDKSNSIINLIVKGCPKILKRKPDALDGHLRSNVTIGKKIATMRLAQKASQKREKESAGKSTASHSSQDISTGSEEMNRFKAHWKGKTANFVVTKSWSSLLDGTRLEVKDSDTGKKFVIHYNVGIDKGLFKPKESAVGATVSIRFGEDGLPASIKNPANGRSTDTGRGWRIEGYGW